MFDYHRVGHLCFNLFVCLHHISSIFLCWNILFVAWATTMSSELLCHEMSSGLSKCRLAPGILWREVLLKHHFRPIGPFKEELIAAGVDQEHLPPFAVFYDMPSMAMRRTALLTAADPKTMYERALGHLQLTSHHSMLYEDIRRDAQYWRHQLKRGGRYDHFLRPIPTIAGHLGYEALRRVHR